MHFIMKRLPLFAYWLLISCFFFSFQPSQVVGAPSSAQQLLKQANSYEWLFSNGIPNSIFQGNSFAAPLAAQASGPESSFTFVVNGSEVVFTNTSANSTSYAWNVEDQNFFSEDLTYTFDEAGTYVVCLFAFDTNGGADVYCQSVEVGCGVDAGFTYASNGLELTLTNTSYNADDAIWDMGDGTINYFYSPSHIYESAGMYEVCQLAYNIATDCDDNHCEIVVIAEPEILDVDFSYSFDGNTATFINESDYASGFAWSTNNTQFSTAENPIYTFPAAGTYEVCLFGFNEETGEELLMCKNVEVGCDVMVDFATASIDGLTVSIDNQSDNANRSTWRVDGEEVSSSTNLNYSFDAPGTYEVCLTSSYYGSCPNTTCSTVTVDYPEVNAFFTYYVADYTLNGYDASQGATASSWTIDGQEVATTEDLFHLFDTQGTYEVCLEVTNDQLGVSDQHCETLTIACETTAAFEANIDDLTVEFLNQSIDSDEATWIIDGESNGFYSPIHTFEAAGTYEVCLTAHQTGMGCDDTYCETITVEPIPFVVNFSSDVNGLNVALNSTSINATNLVWDIEGEQFVGDESITYDFSTPGAYDVCLSGEEIGGSEATNICKTVYPGCDADASFTVSANDLSVSATNTSTNADDYNWVVDGIYSSSTDMAHTFSEAGTYEVCLTASNTSQNCSDEYCTDITVTAPAALPEVGFDFFVNNLQVSFNNFSANASFYEWTLDGDVFSTAAGPLLTLESVGTYEVCLTAFNADGLSDSACETIEITCDTEAAFSYEADSLNMYEYAFTNESVDSDEASWSIEGQTYPFNSAIHTFSDEGFYNVCLTAFNALKDCEDTHCETVTVGNPPLPAPEAGFSFFLNDLTVNFNNYSNHATTYEWTVDGDAFASNANPIHVFDAVGTYEVCLTASNEEGDTSTACETIEIVCETTAAFSYTVSDLTIELTSESVDADESLWTIDGQTNGFNIFTYTFAGGGDYEVCLTATNPVKDCSDTYCETITVEGDPAVVADFDYSLSGLTLILDNNSENADFYAWTVGGVDYDTENVLHTFPENGSYEVCLFATNTTNGDGDNICKTIVTDCDVSAVFSLAISDQTVTLTNLSTGADQYLWNVDGSTFTSTDLTYTFTTGGIYQICLDATDSQLGCTESFCQTVSINEPEEELPLNVGFTYVLDNFTAIFDNYSSGADTYEWYINGDLVSTSEELTYTFPSLGAHDVCLTVANSVSGESTFFCEVIDVSCNTFADFGCTINDLEVQFINESIDTDEVYWTINGDPIPAVNNPFHIFEEPGVYQICLTALNTVKDCEDSYCKFITVEAPVEPVADFTYTFDGLTTTFVNTSSDFDFYTWNINGELFEEPVVTYEFPEMGDYQVCLDIGNSTNGLSDSKCETITIGCEAAASFTWSNNGLEVTATSTSTNANDYRWVIDNNNLEVGETMTYTFAEGGTHTICLEARDTNIGGCVNEFCETIEVYGPVTADFTFDITDFTVSFTNNSENANMYAWSVESGTTLDDENPVHTYTDEGLYTVCLFAVNTVTNEQAVYCEDVTIACSVSADFTYQFLDDTNVLFNSESEGYNALTWFIDDNIIYSTGPNYDFELPGDYEICLYAANTNTGCSETYCETITVLNPDAVIADFTYDNDGLAVDFTDASFNADTYSWTIESTTSTDANPSHTFSAPSLYSVCLTASNSVTGEQDQICKDVNLSCVTEADFMYSVTGGETLNFVNTSTFADSYLWIIEGASYSSTDLAYTFDDQGVYEVCLTATNSTSGCTNNVCKYVNVTSGSNVSADFSYTVNLGEVSFTNESSGADIFEWEVEDGVVLNDLNPVHTYTESGSYEVCLTVISELSGEYATYCETINIDICPVDAGFSVNLDGYLLSATNSSTGYTSLSWDFGDGGSSTEEMPTHQYTEAGTYTITLSATDGTCTDATSIEVTVEDQAGTCPLEPANALEISYIFVNSCGNPESQNEAAVFVVGPNALDLAEMQVNWARTTNSWFGHCQTTGTAAAVSAINATITGGGSLIEPLDGILPACAEVLILTSESFNYSGFDFSDLDRDIYVVFQCDLNNTNGGHFLNSGNNQEFSISFGAASDWVTYGNDHLTGTDGDYVLFDPAGNAVGGNDGCVFFDGNQGPPIAASFDYTANGQVLDFANTSTVQYTNSTWDFGDGNTAAGNNPQHTYTVAGDYLVSLTVTLADGGCLTTQQPISVGPPIHINKILVDECGTTAGSQEALCFIVGNTAVDVDDMTITWPSNSWGGVCTNPTTTAAINATLTDPNGLVLEPTDGVIPAGAEVMIFTSVNVDHSVYDFSLVDRTVYVVYQCGSPVQGHFSNSPTSTQTVSIDFGTGIATASYDGSHLDGSGDGSAVVFPEAGEPFGINIGCTLFSDPADCDIVANFSYSKTDLTVDFTSDLSGSYTDITWDFGDGNTATDLNPQHTYASPSGGQGYEVCLIAISDITGCYDVDCRKVVVNNGNNGFNGGGNGNGNGNTSARVAAPDTYVDNETNCGVEVTFDYEVDGLAAKFNNTSKGDFDSVLWSFGDGEFSEEMNPSHTYDEKGQYFFTFTIKNSRTGCESTHMGYVFIFDDKSSEIDGEEDTGMNNK